MSYSRTNSNFVSSTGVSPAMQTYYNRTLLQALEPELVHLRFAEEYPMPRNHGNLMSMRKIVPVETKTGQLAEGNPGSGVMLNETSLLVQLRQYGDYANFSDLFDYANIDFDLTQKVKLFANAGARSIDAIVRDELATCTNVIYAGGKTTREELTSEDKLTSKELRKAVRTLKKNNAQRFDGYYIGIIGPDALYDLQEDESFVRVAQYQDKEAVYKGEVGRLYGVRLIETSEAKMFTGAGASGADVASIIVLGRYAYGVTSWKGAKPRVIIKAPGSAGTADPLDQISSVGWKMDGFGVKLLQPEYAVRIECGVSA